MSKSNPGKVSASVLTALKQGAGAKRAEVVASPPEISQADTSHRSGHRHGRDHDHRDGRSQRDGPDRGDGHWNGNGNGNGHGHGHGNGHGNGNGQGHGSGNCNNGGGGGGSGGGGTGGGGTTVISGTRTGALNEDGTVLATTGVLTISGAPAPQANFVAQTGTAGTYGSFSLTSAGTWTYALNNSSAAVQALAQGQTITESFAVVAADGTTSTVAVTVGGRNDAPEALAAGARTQEDRVLLTGSVSAGDVDAGSVLTYSLAGAGAGARSAAPAGLSLNADGSFSFDASVPEYQSLGVGQSRVLAVPYTVTDQFGASSTSTLAITVTGTNDAPQARAASFSVSEDGSALRGSLIAADVDSGAALTFALVSARPAGLTLNADGSFSFNPADAAYQSLAHGQTLTLNIPYAVSDEHGATSSSSLSITLTGTNDATTISGVAVGLVSEDGASTVSSGTLIVNDADAGQASFVAQPGVEGTYGSFSLSTDGAWSYSLDNSSPGVQALAEGESITESFAVASVDGTTRRVEVTVNGSNDAPAAISATIGAFEDGSVLSGSVSATDADAGSTLSYSLAGAGVAPAGLIFNADGSFSFDASVSEYQDLGDGESRVLDVAYSVTDQFSGSSTATLTITVTGTNDAPRAQAASFSLSEDDPALRGNLIASDLDGNAILTFALTAASPPGLNLQPNGSFSFDPTDPSYQALADGQTLTLNIPYSVTDEHGATATSSFSIALTGANDVAVISGMTAGAVSEDGATALSSGVLVVDDADTGQASFVAQSNVAGRYGSFSVSADGAWTYSLDNSAAQVQALDVNQPVTESFIIASADGSSTSTVRITITGNNDAPIARADLVATTEDKALTIAAADLLHNDSDSDNGAAIGISSVQDAVGGTVALNAVGDVVFTPTANLAGAASFTYTIGDGAGGSSTASVDVNVAAVGDAPGLATQANQFSLRPGAASISTLPETRQDVLEATLGLAPNELDNFSPPPGATTNDPGPVAVTGGALTSYTLHMSGGHTANFNWQFFNGQSSAGFINTGFNDMAILVVTDPNGVRQLVQLSSSEETGANVNGATVDSSGNYHFNAAMSGEYRFSWLVVNGGNSLGASSLSVAAPSITIGATTYGMPMPVSFGMGLVDQDGSETLSISVSGVPAGAAFSAGTDLGGGAWSFTAAQLSGLQFLPPVGFSGTVNLTLSATATEQSNGTSATSTQAVALVIETTTASAMGTQSADTFAGTIANDHLQGFGGNDVLSGGDGNDLIYGDAGTDTLNGGNGRDVLLGGVGNDSVNAGVGDDRLAGGAGTDALTGGLGSDVFAWTFADVGAPGAPGIDTISDFEFAPAAGARDVLDLRDLLQGEAKAGFSAGTLDQYLDFDTTSLAGSTIIRISSSGGFTGGAYNAAAEDQRIEVAGVDMRSNSVFGLNASASDNAIITQLLQRGQLIADGP
jgi:VCBS repeat-containing protein